MLRKISIAVTLIFAVHFMHGQSSNAIIENIMKMADDSLKVNLLNDLSSEKKSNDSISRMCALHAKEISEAISYDKGLSTSYARLGLLEKLKGNYKAAEDYYIQSLTIAEKNKYTYGIVRAKRQLSSIYQKTIQYEKAIQFGEGAIVASKSLNNPKYTASLYGTIASMYEDTNDFNKALKAYHRSIEIREEISDRKKLVKSYLNIGVLYKDLKRLDLAEEYLYKAEALATELENYEVLAKTYTNLGSCFLDKNKLDTAQQYFTKSLAIKDSLDLSGKDALYNNIALVYDKKKEFDKVEQYFLSSIEIASKEENELQLLKTYFNLGVFYREQEENEKALDFLKKSDELAKKRKNKLMQLDIYMGIAEAYEHLENYEQASLFNEKHIVLRDSLDIKFWEAELYQIEREKNKTISAENEWQRLLITGLIIITSLSALLFFAIFYGYRFKKRKELEIQKNVELLKKQELKTVKAMINGQESERKRIAQDLHDRLGSMLSMVKLSYKWVEDNLDKLKEENKQQYTQANAMLDEACNTVREIAHNMVSGVLTKFGLVAALEDLKNTIQGTNTFQIEIITHGLDDRLENHLEMELYGITQELIHNVIKHANAKEVIVQLVKRANEINLTVIDDGVGFVYAKDDSKSGIGLKGIESRVDALNGNFEIDSGKGNGTTINIDIPL